MAEWISCPKGWLGGGNRPGGRCACCFISHRRPAKWIREALKETG
jgi:hypothetical protein